MPRDLVRSTRLMVEIRSAQKLAAVARANLVQQALDELEARLETERETNAERQQAWSEAASQASLDPYLLQAWGRALLEGDAAVDVAASVVRRGTARRDAARAETRVAEARHQAAGEVARKVGRRARVKAEELSIAAAEDRFAWTWGTR
jgi:hypothetical protein